MKTLKVTIAMAFFCLTLFSSCDNSGTEQKSAQGTTSEAQVAGVSYTCPMDPEVVSDKPGKCPKCGMFLKEVKPGEKLDSAAAAHEHQEGELH